MPQADSKRSPVQVKKQTVPIDQFPKQFEEDTIDFYEIWITLWKNKVLIIAITIVAALGSIIYALQQQHLYKSKALLLPPKAKNIQTLNILEASDGKLEVKDRISSEDVFNKFKKNLISRTIHKKFILENGLIEMLNPELNAKNRDEEIYNRFSSLITLEDIKGATSFSIALHDAEMAAKWVNDLTEFVDKETIHQFVQDKENSIENRVKEIEYNIRSKRLIAKKRREDQIVRYTEHAEIAERLGMIGRVDATNIIQSTQNLDIASATTPLYYLGHEALMTEINILVNRKSDDPFITGLRDLQEELAVLSTIAFDKTKMRAVHVDQAAYPPTNAFSPNRRLIVSFATVVGFISAIFLAFFIEFISTQRKKHSG